MIGGQFVTLIVILLSIPIPLMLPVLVDEVLLDKPAGVVATIDALFGSGEAWYYVLVVLMSVIALRFAYFLVSVFQTKIFMRLSKEVTFALRKKMISRLEKVSMNDYETLGSGAIGSNLVTDINTLDSFIVNSTSKLVASVLTLLGVAVVMIAIHPLLGLLILLFQPLVMLMTKRIAKSVGRLKKEENAAIEDFQQDVGETLDLFGQIKASNKEHYFFAKLIEKAHAVKESSNLFGYKSLASERFSYTLFLSSFELFRAAGLILVVYSDLSIGMMFAMFGYIWFIMTPIQDILNLQYAFASADAALDRVNRINDLRLEPFGTKALPRSHGGIEIELQEVGFGYKSKEQVLDGVSMCIRPKQKLAIIGSSGSGKTTLAQLIAGFYHKESGELLFNGIEIDDLSRQSLRSSIFLVLQMPILFNESLKFNLTMGESYSEEAMMKALEIAQMGSFVKGLESGLDTVVGKNGVRLSGGQRQRLSIARMILADPEVVIFDESTSALDVHTESKLFEALQPILENKTVITIAHRLSTVLNADHIYVLENGKIVEDGTHEELESKLGHYYEFLQKQKS